MKINAAFLIKQNLARNSLLALGKSLSIEALHLVFLLTMGSSFQICLSGTQELVPFKIKN